MKRIKIGWILLVSLTVFFSPSSAHAISLDFVPSAQIKTLGDTATVDIRISGLADLAAPSLGTFDLDVSFSPAILSFSSLSFGDPILGDQLDLSSVLACTLSLCGSILGVGSVNFFEVSTDLAADLNNLQAGEFILASLTFNTLAVGTSPLGLSNLILSDADANSLVAGLGGGSVTVIRGAAVPEPSTLLLFGFGLAGLVAFRRRQQQM